MKIQGFADTWQVFVDGKKLFPDLSLKVFNHSPDGFSWGYHGSGPAQLALALLLLVTDKDTAVSLHQDFKTRYIALFEQGTDFTVNLDIGQYVAQLRGFRKLTTENQASSFTGKVRGEGSGECGLYADRCFYAETEDCMCQCGGKQHGKYKNMK